MGFLSLSQHGVSFLTFPLTSPCDSSSFYFLLFHYLHPVFSLSLSLSGTVYQFNQPVCGGEDEEEEEENLIEEGSGETGTHTYTTICIILTTFAVMHLY